MPSPAESVHLCDAFFSAVWRYDGTLIRHAADNYPTDEMRAILTKGYPAPARRGSAVAQAITECRILHVEDLLNDAAPAASREVAIALGYRTLLCVPMLRDGASIGAIAVARREQQPFSDRQIELVKTFPDQAVIAIENVRLFNELEARNRERSESLEHQTATGDILRVISSSPTDVQPVFETIVRSAVRLCNARFANVFRLEGDVVHLAAHHNVPVEALEHFRRTFPQPLSQGGTLTAQAMRQGTVVHIHDVEAQSDVATPVRALTRSAGYRSVLAVPMLRPGNVVGAIGVGRSDVTGAPWPFSDKEVALLQTFADQAVIAIENVRLVTELQEKNQALTRAHAQVSEAPEQQTATSEILQTIAHAQTDVQPKRSNSWRAVGSPAKAVPVPSSAFRWCVRALPSGRSTSGAQRYAASDLCRPGRHCD